MSNIKPLKLNQNRVWRTYLGGKLLDNFLGNSNPQDNHFPEEWIASTIPAINIGREGIADEGLSTAYKGKEQKYLKDIIAGDPIAYLGYKHVNGFGSSTGVLIKLLDSAERLSIQVHPTKEKAKKLFNSNNGKTESWHILECRNESKLRPYILLGFKKGITEDKWREYFYRQDVDGMINALNKLYVSPGDTFLVNGGMPHAIGPGCLILEIQEPTDYTIRVERTTSSGFNIPDILCHQGLGFEKMFECFEYKGYSKEDIKRKYQMVKKEDASYNFPNKYSELISYEDTHLFALDKVIVYDTMDIECENFSVLVFTEGSGFISINNSNYKFAKGDKFFMPYSIKKYSIIRNSKEDVSLLVCKPPKT